MKLFQRGTIQSLNSSLAFVDAYGYKCVIREDQIKGLRFIPESRTNHMDTELKGRNLVELSTEVGIFWIPMFEDEFLSVCAYGSDFEKEYGKPFGQR